MTTRTKWERVINSFTDPMTIIPIFLGALFAFFAFYSCDEFKTMFTVISAVGLGIGVNYFTFYYKEQKEKEILYSKAEHTIRSMDLIIKTLLRRAAKDSVENRNTIDSLLNIIDYWKDYYPKADVSQIEKLKSLRAEILAEIDTNEKTAKQNKLNKLEIDVSTGGLSSYIPLSGGTMNYH
jgi:hypothetical protein